MTNITAPSMGESITEATVAQWLKQEGDAVTADEVIAELETDKVNLEVNAPVAGVLGKIRIQTGGTVHPGDVMGEIAAQNVAETSTPSLETVAPISPAPATPTPQTLPPVGQFPAAAKLAQEQQVDTTHIPGSGKGGRVTKGDVLAALANPQSVHQQSTISAPTTPSAQVPAPQQAHSAAVAPVSTSVAAPMAARSEERVPMTRIRQTIASRLKQAQNTAAMLTTYNEIDLHAVMQLRQHYKDDFQKQYNVKLGYMSFFTKAVVGALQAFPALNAEISGTDIVYKNYYDIGIAVASARGLVVPVVRNADQKSFAAIETDIADFGTRAQAGKLQPDELQGGTFSITNGGTFGSMLSMPILNYPQVGILGMHNIVERPHVVHGEIKIRPIMYVALTYDHRIVDGKEAVSFLVKVKQQLEDPGRMVLGL